MASIRASIDCSKAHKTALAALVLTLALATVNWKMAWVPPALFLTVCLIAPFIYRSSFFLHVISRGDPGSGAVALTFDDGPDPVTTPLLLTLLKDHDIQAAFFLTGCRARAHPMLVRAIIEAGHSVGNHSYSHNSLMPFRGKRVVFREIASTQHILTRLGVVPTWYRPPVGITYPALKPVLTRLNLQAVTFTCRARDRGNRKVHFISRRILKKITAGDIVLLHDVRPANGITADQWLAQIRKILVGLESKGLAVRPLTELIGDLPPPETPVRNG